MIYALTLQFDNHSTERRFTDDEHLQKAIQTASSEDFYIKELTSICVNETYICFDGYFELGDFVRQINI